MYIQYKEREEVVVEYRAMKERQRRKAEQEKKAEDGSYKSIVIHVTSNIINKIILKEL